MVFSAQGHQVLNAVSILTSTHAPCLNVVYIVGYCLTHFARHKVTGRDTEIIKVNPCMLLHGYKVCATFVEYLLNVYNFLKKLNKIFM